jgi:NADH-quinone oxidoreductase subunit N
VPKISILCLLTRFCYIGFYDLLFSWQDLLIIASILSVILGALCALIQLKLKRLFAYSGISHIGYILVGFCCESFEGVLSAYFYILVYIVMTITCFISIIGFYEKKKLTRLIYIKDLIILKRSNILFALLLSITLFSMAGIPPLAGFFSKAFLFIASIQSKLYILAVIGVLTTIISCFYYIRIIKTAYFNVSYRWSTFIRFDREKSIVFGSSSLLLLFISSYPTPVLFKIHNALFLLIKNL